MEKKRDHIASNAGKGGTVFNMATDNCIKETSRQICDKANYKELTEDTTLQHNRIQTKERFKNEKLLPKKTSDNLKTNSPKTPKFYITPTFINGITLENQ